MKQRTAILTAACAILMGGMASCSNPNGSAEGEMTAQDTIAQLSEEYSQAQNFNDSLLLLMGDIYTGLDSINMQEQLLYTPGAGDNANRRAEIQANLSAIRARLNANRKLLNEMQGKLNASNQKNSVQAKTITQLQARIDAQEKRITELQNQLNDANAQIGQLNNQVAETQEQVKAETAAKEEAQQQATETANELNTVYFAIGTNKELKKQGLLEKKFLGATKVMKGDFNRSYFTKADKRTLTTIPTSGKKVKIWTNMPSGTYQIVTESNGTQSVKITSPERFWQYTPYLIIQIDK